MNSPQLNEPKNNFIALEAALDTPEASSRLKGCLERVHQAIENLEAALEQDNPASIVLGITKTGSRYVGYLERVQQALQNLEIILEQEQSAKEIMRTERRLNRIAILENGICVGVTK